MTQRMVPDDSVTDPVDVDERAERLYMRIEILLGSAGLALFVNAAISVATAFDSRPIHLQAGHLLVTSVITLIPLRDLSKRNISRRQLAVLIGLAAILSVVARVTVYS